MPNGVLWFSDVPGNLVRSVTPAGQVRVLIQNAGGTPVNPPRGAFIGPNGMVSDKDGAVLLCQHTNRRIVRVAKDLTMAPYIEKFEGHRLNSPNDLVYRSDGSLYFTDPPYGLTRGDNDPAKELEFNGVFQYKGGQLKAVIKDLNRPNGLGFSPDDSDERKRFWMRYDVAPDGTVSNGRLFFDLANATERGIPDGLKIDLKGNVWAAGPERRLGLLARGQASGHPPARRNGRQPELGRRRQNALYHRQHQRVPYQGRGDGRETAVPDL